MTRRLSRAWLQRGPLACALWPVSLVYALLARLHLSLYKLGLLKAQQLPVPVLVVGNILVGGAGKTPHVEYLAHWLSQYLEVATLSRGYGRKDEGTPAWVDGNTLPADGGDEPVLAPAEVVPGVWASNRSGAALANEEFAVVSLCRIEPSARRPVRREVYLVDKPGGANASLDEVLDDVLDSIGAFLAEGRQVLVHCHGGRSRTGLMLAGHLMRQGHSLEEALALLKDRWPHAHLRNESFADLLSR